MLLHLFYLDFRYHVQYKQTLSCQKKKKKKNNPCLITFSCKKSKYLITFKVSYLMKNKIYANFPGNCFSLPPTSKYSLLRHKRTQSVAVTNYLLMPFKEVIPVQIENYTEPMNTKCRVSDCYSSWYTVTIGSKGLTETKFHTCKNNVSNHGCVYFNVFILRQEDKRF
jgi:hypothetical protein